MEIRHDWTVDEIRAIYEQPLMDLVYRAQTVHRDAWGSHDVQLCSLLSIKTGGCSEDCSYCPQAARYNTGVESEALLSVEAVLGCAEKARDAGASRFCMGAAWRGPKGTRQFSQVLDMVRGVKELGMEACCTLGMLTQDQAHQLAEAGLTAYNHNIDTSPTFYDDIISTRDFADRLRTLSYVRDSGVDVCCGGIVGMGETIDDRCAMLQVLATMEDHPESVPVNALVAVEGTPLQDQKPVETIDMVRMIATARILMPQAKVRLSAGRAQMSDEAQLLCMMAGANSIFFGDQLLTTANPGYADDMALFEKAGIRPLPAHAQPRSK